jgi:hypothetical protein
LALKKISSIRQISGLLKPVEGKFIQVQKDVGNDKGVAVGFKQKANKAPERGGRTK